MADEDGDKTAEPATAATATDGGSGTAGDTGSEGVPGGESPSADASSGGTTGGDAPSAEPGAPKKKKKKKKKKPVEDGEPEKDEKRLGPVLNAEGWERPGFVLDFPKDAELDRIVRAFELGNYAFVREQGKKLVESSSDAEVRRAAGELLRRVEPDPLIKILFSMSVALLLFMVVYAYRSHAH
ncbi:MAG TPA: hypothetical protein VFZ53_19465 [Polyangiaceae bacterium]